MGGNVAKLPCRINFSFNDGILIHIDGLNDVAVERGREELVALTR